MTIAIFIICYFHFKYNEGAGGACSQHVPPNLGKFPNIPEAHAGGRRQLNIDFWGSARFWGGLSVESVRKIAGGLLQGDQLVKSAPEHFNRVEGGLTFGVGATINTVCLAGAGFGLDYPGLGVT